MKVGLARRVATGESSHSSRAQVADAAYPQALRRSIKSEKSESKYHQHQNSISQKDAIAILPPKKVSHDSVHPYAAETTNASSRPRDGGVLTIASHQI